MSAEFGKSWDPTRKSLENTKYAYEIEGQAISIKTLQAENKLRSQSRWLMRNTITLHDELGLSWWKIGSSTYFSEHCNEEVVKKSKDR